MLMNQSQGDGEGASSFSYSFDMLEFRPEWQFDDPVSGVYYHSAVIPGKLFYTSLGGDISPDAARKAIPYLERVFADRVLENTDYVRIADYSEVVRAAISTRLLYASTINRLNAEYSCRPVITYICGASQLLKAMLRIFSSIVRQRFVFVDTVEDAFSNVNRSSSDREPAESDGLLVSRREIDEFAATCGHLLFENKDLDDAESAYYSPDHPLNELFKVIVVLRNDLQELQDSDRMRRKETEVALDESRKLNDKLVKEKRNVEEKEKIQQGLIENLKNARIEAESANKAKSDFLANISHELRTPLHAVIGMTELLIETKLDKDQRYYSDTLYSSAQMLLMLINDILDFSRIEAGRIDEDKEVFNLRQLLQDIIAIMKEKASCKGLVLAGDIDANIPSVISGYPGYIKQVLLNLIQNAIKFTYRGQVTVTVTVVSETHKDVSLKVAVQDTGIGIPEEQQHQIFNPFTQIDASSTRKEGGTGLGLAIVRKLIAFMGGEIQVTSSERDGSTFSFTLAFDKVEGACDMVEDGDRGDEAEVHQEDVSPSDSEKNRVLLVEDNTINQKVAQAMLLKMGYHIDIAFNGADAVEALKLKNYGLVLMDLQMPVMDGYEATRTIRQGGSELDSKVPIVAMTANATKEDRQKCMDAGMDDFVAKPVERKVMTAMLQRWLPLSDHS